MKKIQRSIDVLATFRAGMPPEPHRFRIVDRDDNTHVLKVERIVKVEKQKVNGDEVWTYECQGMIGKSERIYVMQFNIPRARWQLVKI